MQAKLDGLLRAIDGNLYETNLTEFSVLVTGAVESAFKSPDEEIGQSRCREEMRRGLGNVIDLMHPTTITTVHKDVLKVLLNA